MSLSGSRRLRCCRVLQPGEDNTDAGKNGMDGRCLLVGGRRGRRIFKGPGGPFVADALGSPTDQANRSRPSPKLEAKASLRPQRSSIC
uniref:Uncharacterized protein n=1 Tax=Rhipicephalus appendiculatus TaxID=34631 RepID=A0A131YFM1_RHIAP